MLEVKKSAEKFCGNKKKFYLRGMEERKYIITGVNCLTGYREELSQPMTKEDATARLERENRSRAYLRYKSHKNLRVERVQPIQLSIQWNREQ